VPRHLALAVAVVAAAAVAAPANAATKPKPFKKTVTFTDATPDPTGGGIASSGGLNICDGTLPRETGVKVTIPAPGKLKISIAGFVGDWALSLRDSKGEYVDGVDVDPDPTDSSVTESMSHKFKKAGKYVLLPCNLGGSQTAKLTYQYLPS
jgi:hypothetical protein